MTVRKQFKTGPESYINVACEDENCEGYCHKCPIVSSSIHKEEFKSQVVDHPDHYGGKDNPYEAIKIIEAWQLGFCLGNTIKYVLRAGKKSPDIVGDLKKAAWYLQREIDAQEKLQRGPNG